MNMNMRSIFYIIVPLCFHRDL